MGVPKLQNRYIKPILSSQRNILPTDVSSLHIDATASIYAVVAEVCGFASEDKFDTPAYVEADQQSITPSTSYEGLSMLDVTIINGTVRKMQEYYTKYTPTNLVHMAFDGRIPSAKLNQQRIRRELAARRRMMPIRETEGIEDNSAKARLLFDTNKITPGTRFMEVLDEIFMARFPTNNAISSSNCIFLYSSYREEGEGEHKIIKLLRSNIVPPVGSHLIISSDSDMVILASLLNINNMYVFRESINTTVNVSMLKFHLSRMYNKNTYKDSVLLLQVLGNDFLPPQPSFLPGPEGQVMPPSVMKEDHPAPSLFDEYNTVGKELIITDEHDKIKINWQGFREILTLLSNTEYDRLRLVKRHATEKDPRWSEEVFPTRLEENDKQAAYEEFRAAWYSIALSHIPVEERPDEIKKMCSAYLRTLAWTCVYYFEGTSSSSHIYPYRYAPLLSDLVALSWTGEYENEMRVTREKYMEDLPTLEEQILFVIPSKNDDSVYGLIQSVLPSFFPSPLDITIDTLGLSESEDAEIVSVGRLLPVYTGIIREVVTIDYFVGMGEKRDTAEAIYDLYKEEPLSNTRYDERPLLVVETKTGTEKGMIRGVRQRPVVKVPSTVVKVPPKVAPKAPVKVAPKAPIKVPVRK